MVYPSQQKGTGGSDRGRNDGESHSAIGLPVENPWTVVKSVLIGQVTAAIAAATILFGCGMSAGDPSVDEGAIEDVEGLIAKVRESMSAVHSYRVDGVVTIHSPRGASAESIIVRGDWVAPDRLEWDVSGLHDGQTDYLVIVGDRAYQRARNTRTLDWSEWAEFDADAVDSAYAAGLVELTLGMDEYLARIPWSQADSLSDGIILLRGVESEDEGRIVTRYRMEVREAGPVPLITLRRWIQKIDVLVVYHGGPERRVIQQASYPGAAGR